MRALLDGIGMSVGFAIALVLMSGVREVLGNGSFLGFNLLGPHFEPWVIMVLPPGGFLTLGLIMLAMGWHAERKKRLAKAAA